MKEFDWKFFKEGKRIAVHLATKEEAEDFCRQLNGRWDGETLNMRFWSVNGDKTCCEFHRSDLIYRNIDDYTANDNCEILEWNDFMFKKSLMKPDLKNDVVLEDREGRKYLVINNVLSGEGMCHSLNSFEEDLLHRYFSEYDIVAAYRIKNDFFGPLKEIFKDRNLILTWRRKSSEKEE